MHVLSIFVYTITPGMILRLTTAHINHTMPAPRPHFALPLLAAELSAAAAFKAMRTYALTRAIASNHGQLTNTIHTPPVVLTPSLHAANHE